LLESSKAQVVLALKHCCARNYIYCLKNILHGCFASTRGRMKEEKVTSPINSIGISKKIGD
jgi:hypothetical protein